MHKNLKNVAKKDLMFVNLQIYKALNNNYIAEFCDEIIAYSRKSLIEELKRLKNKKMLKRVRSNRHEYWLLVLNHSSKTLRLIELPIPDELLNLLNAA